MKLNRILNLTIALSALIAFSSCSDDEDDPLAVGPSLSVTEITTATANGADITVFQGETLKFAWDARKGDVDMETFTIVTMGVNSISPVPNSFNGESFPYDISNANDELYVDSVGFSAGQNVGTTTYTFTVTDAAGLTQSVSYDVMVEENIVEVDLSDPIDFTWMRVAGASGTGLSDFGLAWNSNTATNASITISAMGAEKMVILNASDYVDISTEQELAAAIDAGTSAAIYQNVSVAQSASYNDVIGVRYNGTDFILNIQSATVVTGGAGTTVTIQGEYKN